MTTLIKNAVVLTVDPADTVWLRGWVLVQGERIAKMGEGDAPAPEEGWRVIDAAGKAVMPGIVDVHTHVCGSLFKGMTEDAANGFYGLALPMERLLTEENTYTLSLLGAAECLLAGVTCINDIYHYMRDTARAVAQLGLRGVLAHKIIETDLAKIQYGDYTRLPAEGEARVEENVRLIEEWHGKAGGRITCKFGPHATDTVSVGLAKRIADLGRKYRVGFHTHVAQKPQEVQFLRESIGMTPVEYLCETGLMGEDLTAAHGIYTGDRDIQLLAKGGCMVAHCAEMSGKRGNLMPVQKMYAAGVKVGLGTDWVTMDPWTNLRTAIVVDRIGGCSLEEMNARLALRRATIEPARHLGLGEEIGSLEPGKKADLLLLDLASPSLRPIFDDPAATIAYNAGRGDVELVMVDGEILVEDHRLLRCEEAELLADGQQVAEEIYRKYKEGRG